MKHLITGIQQVGIGVTDADDAKLYYKQLFGFATKVFDDEADATLMTHYTGDTIHRRRAILSMNMAGGGGFEIWQYLSRQATIQPEVIRPGDTGILAVKIKTANIYKTHKRLSGEKLAVITPVIMSPNSKLNFWIKDIFGHWFNIIEFDDWFNKDKACCGGVAGVVIGVSDINASNKFYSQYLGINDKELKYERTLSDFPFISSNKDEYFSAMLLKKCCAASGPFSRLLGGFEIELIQSWKATGRHLFENRFWGDCGFIHLCFDVSDMEGLKKKIEGKGVNFTVDSKNSFAMGKAAGRFCYIEDPDGTLIELVETHRVPVFRKLGIYFKLKNGNKRKPLPSWMINLLGLSKIK